VKLCRRHLKLSAASWEHPGECRQRQLRHPHRRRVALATSKAAAKLLKLPVSQVLPASTGVIGVNSIRGKSSTPCRGSSAAWALIASTTPLAPS